MAAAHQRAGAGYGGAGRAGLRLRPTAPVASAAPPAPRAPRRRGDSLVQRLRQLTRSVRERLELPPPHPQRHEPPLLVAEAEDDLAGRAVAADGEDAGDVELPPPPILARA